MLLNLIKTKKIIVNISLFSKKNFIKLYKYNYKILK